MTPPLISVVIPASNEEKRIADAVASIRNQHCPNIEIIVVVNGSRDKTAAIARTIADHTLVFDHPLGAGGARNEGARIARGEILAFLDADSSLSPNTLALVEEKTKDAYTYGSVRGLPDTYDPRARLYMGSLNLVRFLHLYTGVPCGLFLCHKKLFVAIGGFNPDQRIGEFQDFVSRAKSAGGHFVFIPWASVTSSMRRHEQKGYFKTVWYWIHWKLQSNIADKKAVEQSYDSIE